MIHSRQIKILYLSSPLVRSDGFCEPRYW